jgi:penicillin-binding protein 2
VEKKRTGDAWYPGDTYINSIGQGYVLVSPIQACQMISAVRTAVTSTAPAAQADQEPGDRGSERISSGTRKHDQP